MSLVVLFPGSPGGGESCFSFYVLAYASFTQIPRLSNGVCADKNTVYLESG